MATGIGVNDECLTKFHELKLRHLHRFMIMRIGDDLKTVIVEKTADQGTWEEFIAALPKQDCRYGVFDFEYEAVGGGKRNKLVFVVWAPDTAKVKAKMLYAGSKDTLKKKLEGIQTEIQATDVSEVDYQEVKDRCARFD